jgi:hypothetical protein
MMKRLNYPLLHFLSCTLLGGVDLTRSASLFLISRTKSFWRLFGSSPPGGLCSFPVIDPLLWRPPRAMDALDLEASNKEVEASMVSCASNKEAAASNASRASSKGGGGRGRGGGELGGWAEKGPLRLMRKREVDRERSTPPSNVQERKWRRG